MAITVNTNVASINAQRNLNSTTRMLNRSLERLASGLRINRAGDDAAGLAIATGLQAQIRGLTQATRNANDGLSIIGTAEGAIGQATEILQRIRELAVQAANGINSAANRASIQEEINTQVNELTRIGNTVEFNGQNLLDGSFTNKQLQIGAMSGQTLSISIADFRASSLGKIATSTGNAVVTTAAIDGLTGTANSLVINGKTIGSSVGLDTLSYTDRDGSAIAKAAAINAAAAQTGVSATIVATSATQSAVVGATAGATGADDVITINGIEIINGATGNTVTTQLNDADSALRNKINSKSHLTGVVASLGTGADAGKIVLTAADGRNITVTAAGTTVLARTGFAVATNTTGGKITLTSNSDMVINSGQANLIGQANGTASVSLDAATAISFIDVTTSEGASLAIRIVDSALSQSSSARSKLGAITNRLEYTIANLQTSVENLSASQSRILDADFAAETASMTRAQILQQAGISVLSQANVSPQAALALLSR